jgi:hypothetical protein
MDKLPEHLQNIYAMALEMAIQVEGFDSFDLKRNFDVNEVEDPELLKKICNVYMYTSLAMLNIINKLEQKRA